MTNLIQKLNDALQDSMPDVFADLQPGISTRIGTPRDLRTWFAWRNGQPYGTKHELFSVYSFVSYQSATAELAEMRSTCWKSPLNFMILMALSRRSFYTIPLLTDVAGDGYCYNTVRRRPYYRFKGERDVLLPGFNVLLEFLVEYVAQPNAAAATTLEERFLQNYY